MSDREHAAKTLAKKLPSPLSYSKNGGWSDRKLADLLPLMRTHRPAQLQAEPFQQLPVALFDGTLGQVEEDCAFAAPSAHDTDFAQELMFAMSDSFSNEAARTAKFCDMVSAEFGMHFIRIKSETDGSAMISAGQVLALGANLKVKLDIGTGGGDPRLQNCCYATLYSCDDRQRLLRALCRCPTLLMELSGPNLSLSSFAFGQHPCCDQLSHTVSLLWQPKSELMVGAPRVVHAMRRAWPALQVRYQINAVECSEICKPR